MTGCGSHWWIVLNNSTVAGNQNTTLRGHRLATLVRRSAPAVAHSHTNGAG